MKYRNQNRLRVFEQVERREMLSATQAFVALEVLEAGSSDLFNQDSAIRAVEFPSTVDIGDTLLPEESARWILLDGLQSLDNYFVTNGRWLDATTHSNLIGSDDTGVKYFIRGGSPEFGLNFGKIEPIKSKDLTPPATVELPTESIGSQARRDVQLAMPMARPESESLVDITDELLGPTLNQGGAYIAAVVAPPEVVEMSSTTLSVQLQPDSQTVTSALEPESSSDAVGDVDVSSIEALREVGSRSGGDPGETTRADSIQQQFEQGAIVHLASVGRAQFFEVVSRTPTASSPVGKTFVYRMAMPSHSTNKYFVLRHPEGVAWFDSFSIDSVHTLAQPVPTSSELRSSSPQPGSTETNVIEAIEDQGALGDVTKSADPQFDRQTASLMVAAAATCGWWKIEASLRTSLLGQKARPRIPQLRRRQQRKQW